MKTQQQINNHHLFTWGRKWLPRVALALGAVAFVCVVSAAWYLYPVLTAEEGKSISSFVFETQAGDPAAEPTIAMRHFTLGWFYSTTPLKEVKRILVLGFDQNDNKRPGRTDTMMVVEVHPKKGVGIISIPRDLWVSIPETMTVKGETLIPTLTEKEKTRIENGPEFGRINTVYRLGNRRFGKGKGHRLLKQVLEDELDTEVDYTVAVNYEGFQRIIDVLGGVEVDVQCAIRDNFINESSPTGYEPLDVGAGKQKLTSRQALLFMRSRHGRTDMDRSRRQQRVMMGVRDQLFADSAFWKLPRVISELMPYVKTDMDLATVLRFAATLKTLDKRLHGMVLTPPLVERMETAEKQSVLVLNKEKFEKRKKHLYRSSLPGDRGAKTCPHVDVALHWRDKKKSSDPKPADSPHSL
ncbi:MAG: LCP family protein [Deltaproteobacteria bacterium]|nr:LCP family protein [Deltaproteobacteria bacterium]MBN2672587.1 LCP family protein [Deltaproteobacteria bacterium]